MSEPCYLIAAKRSPVAPRGGALSSINLHKLSTPVIQSLLTSAKIDAREVDEIIVGNALGAGGNPARLIGLAAGLNESVAGLSIDRQCCSGLDTVLLAKDMISSGRASVVIAGGVESYSQRPLRFRVVEGESEPQAYNQPPFTPWPERDPDMGAAADLLATQLNIDFHAQNDWAIRSHSMALKAQAKIQAQAQINNEIVAVGTLDRDSFTRQLSSKVCERATRLYGNISSANAAVAADGSAYCLVVSKAIAEKYDGPKLRLATGVTLGSDPSLPGIAPVNAIKKALALEAINATDLLRAEIMEAYAAQAIACIKQTNIDENICNVGGGALARGHPIAASGAILLTRLFHEMNNTQAHNSSEQLERATGSASKQYGLAAIAAAGGLGTALLLEKKIS